MADIYAPTLVSRTNEANSATNTIFTSISDGTDTLLVNADGSINSVVTATNLDIRDLTHVSDSVKVGDGTDFISVNADGSINITDNGGSITVDGTVAVSSVTPGTGATNLGKAEDSAHTSGDVGVMSLAVRNDAGTPLAADGDYIPLTTDATGALRTATAVTINSEKAEDSAHVSGDIGSYVLSVRQDTLATSTDADGDYASFKVNALGALYTNVTNAAGASAVNIQDGGNSITVDGTVTVTATDLDIRDLTLAQDSVKVSANTSANSATNPIFVQTVNTAITGEVHSYDTTAAVAAGASDNHDYTVVTHFKLKSVKFSNSGGMKVEIQYGPIASLVTAAVGFIPLAGGTEEITFDPPIEVPTTGTGTVRVIRTNRNFVAVDVYSTIVGIDA